MLALIGVLTIVIMLVLIMTKKLQTLLALIIVPIIGCLVAGFTGNIVLEEDVFTVKTMGEFITAGLKSIAPTGVMFIFAILFFGILTDAGTFDPIIKKILQVVGKDPVKICIGTVILACLVHLDGSGAVTFLIAIPAMLPLYEKLGMRKTTLATLVALGAGVMNMLPWGGPTIRAITAMSSNIEELFTPMVIPMICGLAFVLGVAVFLGKSEKKRLGAALDAVQLDDSHHEATEADELKRPHLFIFNIALIIIAVVVLIKSILPPAAVFMIATAIALLVNYPDKKMQSERVDAHAKSALMMASMLFAAGSFIGIMQNSGMLTAMAEAIVKIIPASVGQLMPVLVGIISMPASLLFDPDSYYYGVMPVLASAVEQMGVNPIMIARASIIGQMTTGFPVSPLTGATFLLTGLSGIDLGEHQKHTIPFAFMTTIVMLIVAVIVGSISI